MHKLILDQYSKQSAITRWIGNSLTGLGWIFWIFLWLPLLAAASIDFNVKSELPLESAASDSLLSLLLTIKSHLAIVLALVSLFIAWALVQHLGKHKRFYTLQTKQNPFSAPMISSLTCGEKLQLLRRARMTLVLHESNGRIINVDVLEGPGINDFSPEPLPEAA